MTRPVRKAAAIASAGAYAFAKGDDWGNRHQFMRGYMEYRLDRMLTDAGASSVEALATHCLADAASLARIEAAGIAPVRSTETVAGPTASLPVAALIAEAVRGEGWAQPEAPA